MSTITLTATVMVTGSPPPIPPSDPIGTVQFYDFAGSPPTLVPLGSSVPVGSGVAALVLPPTGGFGAFDKSAQADGGPSVPNAGTLTPANAGSWAILTHSVNLPPYAPPGFTVLFTTIAEEFLICPLPTTTPFTPNFSGLGSVAIWTTNFLIFDGPSYALTATLTSTQITSNILTCVTSPQTWVVGTQVLFPAGLTSGMLDNQVVTILSNTGTTFTAAFTNSNYGSTPESATVTNQPYLQAQALSIFSITPPASITLSKPVTAGSTILVGVLSTDQNSYWGVNSVSDGVNSYTITISGNWTSNGGHPYADVAWAQNVAGGNTTVTVNGSPYNTITGLLLVLELPAPASALAPGTHDITAQYTSSEPYFAGSTSNTFVVVVP
jgi:hypothetical protein